MTIGYDKYKSWRKFILWNKYGDEYLSFKIILFLTLRLLFITYGLFQV